MHRRALTQEAADLEAFLNDAEEEEEEEGQESMMQPLFAIQLL